MYIYFKLIWWKGSLKLKKKPILKKGTKKNKLRGKLEQLLTIWKDQCTLSGVLTGGSCSWVDLEKTGCEKATSGKLVVKPEPGSRKQFLLVSGKIIVAFIKKGQKFASCSTFNDITVEAIIQVFKSLLCVLFILYAVLCTLL